MIANLWNTTQKKTKDAFKVEIENEESQRSLVIFPDDTEKIAKEMKAKLTSEAQKLLIEEQLTESPKAGKILAVLKSRFSNISEERLKMAATRLARNQEGEWKDIVQELHQDNENMKSGAIYQKFSYFPSRGGLELSREYPIHQCIAGFQFYKMMMKWSNACIPVPLRKVSINWHENIEIVINRPTVHIHQVANPAEAIERIDYIKNLQLEEAYNQQKAIFQREGKEIKEMLLFHGTAVANVDSILRSNFSLDHPFDKDNDKENERVFGEGIYFSDMPAISLMYGNGLILCKVLLGECEVFDPQPCRKQPEIPEEFDSREVRAEDGSAVIHVVKKPSQILPYCVIKLKKESLSSEYHKPCHSSAQAQETFQNNPQKPNKHLLNNSICDPKEVDMCDLSLPLHWENK